MSLGRRVSCAATTETPCSLGHISSLGPRGGCLVPGFRVLSLYWAAGGTLGVDQLAVSLQERADERETGFVAIVAATGIAKLLGGIAPL
jgi:hypothetical protein